MAANLVSEGFRYNLHGQRVAKQLAGMQNGVLARYVIQTGDTYISIANKFYGVNGPNAQELITTLNGLNFNAEPPVGLVISIPSLGWRVR